MHSGTGPWQKSRPGLGPQAAMWALTVGVHSCGCRGLPLLYAWQWVGHKSQGGFFQVCSQWDQRWLLVWMPGLGLVGEGVGRVMAAVVCKQESLWGEHLNGKICKTSRWLCWPLVSAVQKATGILWGAVWDLLGGPQRWKLGLSAVSTRVLSSSVVKVAGILCRAGHWEPWILCHMADAGYPCTSSLFLALSRCLSSAGLSDS